MDTSISSDDWAAKKLSNGACNVSGNGNCSTYDLTGNGEWAISFSYGMLKGKAICTARASNNNNETYTNASSHWRAPISELTAAGSGNNCWCQARKLIRSSDGTSCILNMNPIFVRTLTDNCLNACAQRCANLISYSTNYNKRIALYIQ